MPFSMEVVNRDQIVTATDRVLARFPSRRRPLHDRSITVVVVRPRRRSRAARIALLAAAAAGSSWIALVIGGAI